MKPFPLHDANRRLLAEAFRDCRRVDMAIDCALEGAMGRVVVDRPEAPTVFLLRTSIFRYFAGDPGGAAGQALIAGIRPPALLMPAAPGWLQAAAALLGERLQPHTRFSFSADALDADHLRRLAAQPARAGQIEAMNAENIHLLGEDPGPLLSVDAFESVADFLERGRGYFCLLAGEPVGAAYGSLACSKGIEVSIFVKRRQRQRGLATALAARLLLDCLADGLEPHWDAANSASVALARKLGYRPLGSYEAAYLAD